MPSDDAASPCINVCTMDEESGFCAGCFRTLEEISFWLDYSEEERQQILKRLEDRKRQAADSG